MVFRKSILEEFLLELNIDGNANENGEDQNDDIDTADSGNDSEDTGGDTSDSDHPNNDQTGQPDNGEQVDDIDAADTNEEPEETENDPQDDAGEEPPAETGGDDIDAADSGEEPDDGDEDTRENTDGGGGNQNDDGSGSDNIDAADGGDDIDAADGSGDDSDDGDGSGSSGDNNEGSASGSGNNDSGATGSGLSDDEKNAENDIYESLSDEDKMIRNIQLKSKFAQLHEDADNYMESINRITKNDENILPLKKIVVALGKVKAYIVDYLENIYNSTSYIDNFTNYIKFLVVFRTIGNVLKEMSKKDK